MNIRNIRKKLEIVIWAAASITIGCALVSAALEGRALAGHLMSLLIVSAAVYLLGRDAFSQGGGNRGWPNGPRIA